ncbi:MAG: hypothetical protein CMI30_06555 [Opitutae bacterium]|nr:hypothetical protein [Opitutae bacterium]
MALIKDRSFALKNRLLVISITLNLAFLAGLFSLVRIKGGFDYLWIKTSSMIRGQGFDRNYNPHYFNRKEHFARMPKQAEDVLFIGDSMVEHCEWAKLLENSDVLNRGILGDDTLGVLHRIEEMLKPIPPRKIYLMIGINDLFLGVSENHVLENFADILKRIEVHAPMCEVIVHGLLPIDPHRAPKPIPSTTILSLNGRLSQLCREHDVVYLETFAAFADKKGRLANQYSRDGLHLNSKGYQNWKKLLEERGKE